MKAKYVGMFLFLIFIKGEISTASDSWLSSDWSSCMPSPIKTFFSADKKKPDDPFATLPNCFKRTNYLPQPYFLDNGSISDFDLSPAHVKEMKKHWKYLQKVINTPDSDFGGKKMILLWIYIVNLQKKDMPLSLEDYMKFSKMENMAKNRMVN